MLALWFATSIYFNYLTPEFNKYLSAKTDITMVELLSASAYGVVLLSLGGLPLLPPRKLAKPMALVGFCHLWACKLSPIYRKHEKSIIPEIKRAACEDAAVDKLTKGAVDDLIDEAWAASLDDPACHRGFATSWAYRSISCAAASRT